MNIPEILATFADQSSRIYPREAVAAALAAREEVTPCLLDILRGALADPQAYLEKDWDMRPTFAMLLLGYFREPRAHSLLVDLLLLPEGTPYELFGDSVTEDLGPMLVRSFSGEPADLFRLVRSDAADTFSRMAGFNALATLVALGQIERDRVVVEGAAILAGAIAARDDERVSECVDFACHLHPVGLMPLIETAYEQDLVDRFRVGLQDVKKVLNTELATHQERLAESFRDRHGEDFHSWISWWAMYRPTSSRRAPLPWGIASHNPSLKTNAERKAAANKRKAKNKQKAKQKRRRK